MASNRKQLSTDVKEVIVSMRNEGYTLQYIADTLNVPRGTVSDVVVRFKQRGSTENKSRSGRPRALDGPDERSLIRLARTNRKTPLAELTNKFNQHRPSQVSKRTTKRCLYRNGYHRRVVKKKVRIREVNRKKRVNWCRGKVGWPVNGQWDKVIFTDESQVVLGENQRIFIWRRISRLRVSPRSAQSECYDMGLHNLPWCWDNYYCGWYYQ